MRKLLVPLALLALATPSLAETVLVDASSPDTPWVAGATYKAGFPPAGPRFVPYLGAQAPRSLPVALELRSARVGELDIALDTASPARVEGQEVIYERGGLFERYRLSPRSIEQVFVFDDLPGPGDLVLSVAVTSELAPWADAAGVVFGSEAAGVRYGRAVAIDAAGRTVDAPVTLVEGALELRVDAAFLARASFPLVVDPLVTTLSIDTSPFDDLHPDVAYDASLDVYAVCYQRTFSATDTDAHGRILDAAGNTLSEFLIDATLQLAHKPQVAGIDAVDQFLVAFRRGFGNNAVTRTLDVTSGGLAVAVGAPVPMITNSIDHDLGGDPGSTPPFRYCLVAGTVYLGIHFVDVRLIGADGQPGVTYYIGDGDEEYFLPKVSEAAARTTAGTQAWGLAMARGYGSPQSISSARVYGDGTWGGETGFSVGSGSVPIGVSSMLDDGRGTLTNLMAWEHPLVGGMTELRARVHGGASLGPFVTVTTEPDPAPSFAGVDCDGSSFVVTYVRRQLPGTTEYPIAVTYNVESSALIERERARLAPPQGRRESPGLVADRSGGGAPQRFMAVWHDRTGPDGDIAGALYDSPGPGTRYCTGAPNSAGPGTVIRAQGSISLVLDTFELTVTDCPPNTTGIFYLGQTAIQLPFGDGFRCIGGQTRRITPPLSTDASGATSIVLDFDQPYGDLVVPGAPGTNYQFWYRDPTGGPAQFNLSDALHVEHTP